MIKFMMYIDIAQYVSFSWISVGATTNLRFLYALYMNHMSRTARLKQIDIPNA